MTIRILALSLLNSIIMFTASISAGGIHYYKKYDRATRKSEILNIIDYGLESNSIKLLNTDNNTYYTNWTLDNDNKVKILSDKIIDKYKIAPIQDKMFYLDINNKAWYYPYVLHMFNLNLIDNSDKCRPTEFITKKEIMEIMCRYKGLNIDKNESYDRILRKYRLATGLSFNNIEEHANRDDIIDLIGTQFGDRNIEIKKVFKDTKDVRLNQLLNQGVISGDSNGNYSGDSKLTRVEFFSIMSRGISYQIEKVQKEGVINGELEERD